MHALCLTKIHGSAQGERKKQWIGYDVVAHCMI